MPEMKGIDVSVWQGNINWNLVKKAGIEFAIIRTGAGDYKDKMFEKNMKGALAQNIPCGVYHYSMATTEAEAEAEAKLVLGMAKEYTLEYPVAFDLEDKVHHGLTNKQRSDLVDAFCNKVTSDGRHPIVYTSLWWFTTMLEEKRIAPYDKWVAQWAPRCTYSGKTNIWQYSNKGRVSGIEGDVDLDIAYTPFPVTAGKPLAPPSSKPTPPTPSKPISENKLSAGTKVVLKNTPNFISADSTQKVGTLNGTYWIYDGKIINGKIRITNRSDNTGRAPTGQFVTGFVKVSDL